MVYTNVKSVNLLFNLYLIHADVCKPFDLQYSSTKLVFTCVETNDIKQTWQW